MNSRPLRVLLFALAFAAAANAQTTVGIQPFGSYTAGPDQISLSDLGIHIDIPLFSHSARGQGMGTSVHLLYDSAYNASDGIDNTVRRTP